MNLNKHADDVGQVDTGRARSLQELAQLSKRYKQLAWCSSAKDQKERADLDIRIMKLCSTLFPHSSHAWYEDFEVVLRSARLTSRAVASRQVAATNENS